MHLAADNLAEHTSHWLSDQVTRSRAGDKARPIVLALSNPAEVSECTAQEAADYTDGAAVFASGTVFPAVGRAVPAQANNSLVFPGEHSASWLQRLGESPCLLIAHSQANMKSQRSLKVVSTRDQAVAGLRVPAFQAAPQWRAV